MRDKQEQIDMTYLNLNYAENRGVVHRDYIAHCFRWTHVLKRVPVSGAKILDAGCGTLAPLAKTLYTNRMTKSQYLGIDYGPIEPGVNFNSWSAMFWPRTDVSQVRKELVTQALDGEPDIITSFEVLEHMQPDRCLNLLAKFRELISDDGIMIISTPVFNGKAAKNHINEWTYSGLGLVFEGLGLEVIDHYGTFASQSEYKREIEKQFGDAGVKLFQKQHEYYDSNVLSLIWAPLFPNLSRNVIWILKRGRISEKKALIAQELKTGNMGQSDDMAAWLKASMFMSHYRDY